MTEDEVVAQEASMGQIQTTLAHIERQARDTLCELLEFCAEGEKVQKENDSAQQCLHREMGEKAGSANQQQLTGLLIAPAVAICRTDNAPTRTKRGARSGRAVVSTEHTVLGKQGAALRQMVEQGRLRGRRLNFARIKAWVTELEKAIRLGNYELMQRAAAGLTADLTNGAT